MKQSPARDGYDAPLHQSLRIASGVGAYPTPTTPAVVLYGTPCFDIDCSITNTGIMLNILAEFFGGRGLWFPGNANTLNFLKSYGIVTSSKTPNPSTGDILGTALGDARVHVRLRISSGGQNITTDEPWHLLTRPSSSTVICGEVVNISRLIFLMFAAELKIKNTLYRWMKKIEKQKLEMMLRSSGKMSNNPVYDSVHSILKGFVQRRRLQQHPVILKPNLLCTPWRKH
ncbi:hypothetical protein EDD85DRAFT_942829 [Armillaria nabsnona]|nr:hypothetical protein EDD85DRAFT_942829 [Armillaria nabsnona]